MRTTAVKAVRSTIAPIPSRPIWCRSLGKNPAGRMETNGVVCNIVTRAVANPRSYMIMMKKCCAKHGGQFCPSADKV
jgi:hypothetical protein